MDSEHNKKKKIMLWCYTGPSSKKRETVPPKSGKMENAPVRKSNYDSQLKVTKEVDGTCHGKTWQSIFTRATAHMGTHASCGYP